MTIDINLISICLSSSNDNWIIVTSFSSHFFNIGYGIGLSKGSPWRDKISLAILEMQEKGEIQMLYDKWWKKSEETCVRDEKKMDTKANSLVGEKLFPLCIFSGFKFERIKRIYAFYCSIETPNKSQQSNFWQLLPSIATGIKHASIKFAQFLARYSSIKII